MTYLMSSFDHKVPFTAHGLSSKTDEIRKEKTTTFKTIKKSALDF